MAATRHGCQRRRPFKNLSETDFLLGRREDTLTRVHGEIKIARRKIILDQSVLLAKNLTMFF